MRFLSKLSVAKKLVVFLALLASIFLGAVLYGSHSFARANAEHDYLLDHVMARTITLLDFHQKLTQMKLVFGTTLSSPEWQATANEADWLYAKTSMAEMHQRLLDSGNQYMASILSGTRIAGHEKAFATEMMEGMLNYASRVYDHSGLAFYARDNGFSDPGNVSGFFATVSGTMEKLQAMNTYAAEYTRESMARFLALSLIFKLAALCFALAMAAITVYLIVFSLRKRIKNLDKMAKEVQKGNFDIDIRTASKDEIGVLSHTIADMVDTFQKLTREIHTVSMEIGNGNTSARIDEQAFEGGYKDTAIAINTLAEWVLHVSTFLKETESNERIQLMFDAAPILIEYWDKDCKYIECNQRALDIYGISSKQEYKERYFELIPEFQSDGSPSWETWVKHLEKAFEEGSNNFEFTCQKLDGEPIFLEVIALRMVLNNESVMVTYSKDITALIETTNRVREAEERTQLMLDGTPVACYLLNKNFEAIDCNNEVLYLFKFKDKYDAIQNVMEVFLKHDTEKMKQYFEKALETGFYRFEWDLQAPDEKGIPCEITFVRFSHRKEYVIAAHMFDLRTVKNMVKEVKRVAIAEENSLAKSKFLARMSHEIRTPISAVLGISEIQLQTPNLPLSIEEAFAKIYRSSQVLLGIINDILDLSKIEAGKMSIMHEEYEIASLVNDVLQLNFFRIGNKKIKFNAYIDENTPAFMIGDVLRIKQILNNLLSNAFKYTNSGVVELSLQSHITGIDSVMLTFTITDTGRGMTREQLEFLYSEYTRFNEAENRNVEGTGLGMAIVYNLVQLMEATIDIDSQVGKGTRVVVIIPQKYANTEILGKETAKNLRNFEVSKHSIGKNLTFVPEPMPYGNVLVVDDVETNVYVAKGLLSFYEINVETSNSGLDAIDKIADGKIYDIVFMDHMMPYMNGTEATKTIRDMGYKHPIIALTANALIGQAEEFLANGFDGFISKPIDTVHLNGILNKFIRDKQPPEVLEAARNNAKPEKESPAEKDDMWNYFSNPQGTGEKSSFEDKLREEFAKDQANVFEDISAALGAGDIKTAHRLAHTLKGLAGIVREESLAKAAGELEKLLRREETGWATMQRMLILKQELTYVLEQIEAEVSQQNVASMDMVLDKDKTKALFDKLADLLSADSARIIYLIEDLRTVPGADVLVKHVEKFDFEAASKTLASLRESLEIQE